MKNHNHTVADVNISDIRERHFYVNLSALEVDSVDIESVVVHIELPSGRPRTIRLDPAAFLRPPRLYDNPF